MTLNAKRLTLNASGFGLVEVIVGVAVFVLIAVAAYGGFVRTLEGVKVLRVKNAATSLANEQIEIVRNLPFDDVGIVNGLPAGKIPRDQTLTREGIEFGVNTSVRDIDDPFDGTIGGDPNDLSPADYRLVEFTISCENCALSDDFKYYARVSPYGLETQGNNGALFVQVFDANGQPLQDANVHIENNKASTTIIIDETTNNNGMFQIVNAPTGTEAYEITISNGSNYSVDRTYEIGEPANPVPDKPHANVSSGQVTQVSFAIDQLSDLDVRTVRNDCSVIPNVDFNVRGSKTIGLNVYKHDFNETTSGSGLRQMTGIEWDNYFFTITDTAWDLAGSNPLLPLQVNPGSTQDIELVLTNKEPKALLVKVVDSQTGLPVSDADVELDDSSDSIELVTGRGFMIQTNWSGGAGQEDYTNETRYYSNDGNIEDNNPSGEIGLVNFAGSFASNGVLESSTFDIGTTTNFGTLFWNPIDQPVETGTDNIRLQIATNEFITGTTTWDFVGPDGTNSSYYTNPGIAFHSSHNGDRYLRYKVFLQTADTDFTPTVANTSFTFLSECAPPGQVYFTNLDAGEYTLTIDHPSYQQVVQPNFTIVDDWAEYEVVLIPN